ncbi:hypothetical protein PVAND_001575 [Polypedilum vanderplanki]|uniref:Uncharacterized protein n=1 Tax=Polypedilum vanderplanki TaxID=319348 RepID=A0A9J6BPM1_POLVA|nr:hypothetical protein PVAND_001575 [Polypedilum vanderplanki]
MNRGKGKKLTSEEEEIYEDDFEQFNDDVVEDYDDDEEFLKKLGFDKDFLPEENYAEMSNASESPCTDSAGEKLNTKNLHHPADLEFLPTFDGTEYSFDDEIDIKDEEEDAASSRSFDFRILSNVIGELRGGMTKKKYKNGTRSSLTFSNERVKEIDRANKILLDKIMKHKCSPSGDNNNLRSSSSASTKKPSNNRPVIKSAAEINRRKKQQQIIYENAILQRKIEKIASRRGPLSNTFN